jgi:hypothetical protein
MNRRTSSTPRSANVRIGSNNSKSSTMENLLTRLKSSTTGKRPKTLAKLVRMAKKRKRKPRAARRLIKRKPKAEKKSLRAREKAKRARRKQRRLQLMK